MSAEDSFVVRGGVIAVAAAAGGAVFVAELALHLIQRLRGSH